jgi:hypothetical protein
VTTAEVVRTHADLVSAVDQQRPRIEANSGEHFSDPEWEAVVQPAVVADIVAQLAHLHGRAVIDFDRSVVKRIPQLGRIEDFVGPTDLEICRNNYELALDIEGRRREIGRRSGWRFTDDEWDQVLPLIVTGIVEYLPDGDQVSLGDLSGITVSRGPVKRKTMKIQRSPDGLTSTVTSTEAGA